MAVPEKIGRYEILEEVGRGAMGAVYKARDPNIGRVVAIKTILASALSGPLAEEYRKRFQREARAAGMLAHPGIVTVFDVGMDENDGSAYLVMEFITGRTLASALDAGERFPFSSIYDLGGQLADALGYAHKHGVVHRDIKPANILLTAAPGGKADTMVKIADFGVAKLSTSQITTVRQMLGTPAFMSPEQCTGAPIDGRSDLFSLGVILYWMATGDKPFTGETLTALSYKIVHSEPIAPRALNPGMPSQLEKIILKSLAKSAEDRYATGQELAAALRALADPGTIRASIPETPEREVRPVDETTPMLGTPPRMMREVLPEPAPEPAPPKHGPPQAAPPPPPEPYRPPVHDSAQLSAETVTHRTAPLPAQEWHPPPVRAEPPPPPPPPLQPKSPLPTPKSDRAWYDPATRMGTTTSVVDESLLRDAGEPLPPQETHVARNYMPALLGVIGVVVLAALLVVFWPRAEPAPGGAEIAAAQPVAQPASSPASGTPNEQAASPTSVPVEPVASAPAPKETNRPAPARTATPEPSTPPPSRPTAKAPVRLTVGDLKERFISGPQPDYPPLARQARIQDTVRLQVMVSPEGRVTQVEAISGHPLLLQSAIDAVRQWRYLPTLQGGNAVEVAGTVDVVYQLTNVPSTPQSVTSSGSGAPATQPASANSNPPAGSASGSSGATQPAANPPAADAAPPPARATPAKTPEPAPPTPGPESATPSAASGPPTLYGESSKADLRISALGIPQNLELLIFEGDKQIVRRLASSRTSTTDFTRNIKVLPGPRVFKVVFRVPNSNVETSKTERARLDVRGVHFLTIEMRGTDDKGLPRFDVKVK